MDSRNDTTHARLAPGFGALSTWAFSIGTSIGWGSLVVTCGTYLAKAGILGTVFGLILGMLVILVVTHNLRFMITQSGDAGGIYTYIRKVCGYDHGFLSAWFLLLTYISILWANITSVPLFARFFLGDIFRFGFHYKIFGYDVYFGEALLSMITISIVGVFCALCRKSVHIVMIISSLAFVAGFAICTILALIYHGQSPFSYDPLFLPDSSSVAQVTTIAVISPWAFIGFENIAHFSEEYTFPVKKIRTILLSSVIMSTALYICVTLLSVTAYPPEYSNWFEYIGDMRNLSGFKAVPAFYAIDHYLGTTGVVILMIALTGAILTSLIGNLMALSRLLFAGGRDGSAPAFLSGINGVGNPSNAVGLVVVISLVIPFLGRTAIGWIVDVTTLGATLIYAFVSYAVFRDAKKKNLSVEKTTGLAGMILMLMFVLMLLLPNLLSFSAMESASYMLFDLWALIGLIYFKGLVTKDKDRRYGRSVLVWVILLLFVLFASMMWVTKETQSMTDETMNNIRTYYSDTAGQKRSVDKDTAYLSGQAENLHNANALFTVASFVFFIVSAMIIMGNYRILRKREEETSLQLGIAETRAATDPLTGTKNRHAYSLKELEMNDRIASGELTEFAVVVCDVNNLKLVNDREGHKKGDECIFENCRMICRVFAHSPVYRIGGDEFVVILENSDYDNRNELMVLINEESEELKKKTGTSLAVGISEFCRGEDEGFLEVFTRSDGLMYKRKKEMKQAEAAQI